MVAGDVVAIRGDLDRNNNGQCRWLPEQLVDGKYVADPRHGGIALHTVKKVSNDKPPRAKISPGWWLIEHLETMYRAEVPK
jgi:hypothetical protein